MSHTSNDSSRATATELLIAVFADEEVAGKALKVLADSRTAGGVQYSDAAVIRREDDGSLRIKETGDINVKTGAVAGGLLGGLIGLIAGKKLMGAGMGALLGAGAARLFDSGIPDARLAELGELLPNGTSALAAVIEVASHGVAISLLEPLHGMFSSEPVKNGSHVTLPETGIAGIDQAVKKAADAVGPLAGQAAASVSAAASRVEGFTQKATHRANGSLNEAGEKLSDVGENITSAAKDASRAVTDKVSDVTNAVSDAASSAREAGRKVANKASDAVSDVTSTVADAASSVRDAGRKAVNKASDAASDVASDISDAASRAGDAASDVLSS